MAEFGVTIRKALPGDAPRIAEIYRPYIEDSAASFEMVAPGADEIARRMEATHCWFVAELNGAVEGYAYAGVHRAREAYRFSAETTAYLSQACHRRGVGRALYEAMFKELAAQGFESAFAGITLPNEASVGFHEALGFQPIGVFPRIGFKFDTWHDVGWWYRPVIVG